jgi:hypothetical protein
MNTSLDHSSANAPFSRTGISAIASTLIALLVTLRAVAEITMMAAHGSDPQIPIWWMEMAVKIAFLLFTGFMALLLIATWTKTTRGTGGTDRFRHLGGLHLRGELEILRRRRCSG